MDQTKQQAIAQDASREIALTIGGLQMDLSEARAIIRDLKRQLEAAQAEADSLRSQARAVLGAGHEPPTPDAATPKVKKAR